MIEPRLLFRSEDLITDFDFDREGRPALVTHRNDSFYVTVAGSIWASGRRDAEPYVRYVRCLDPTRVVSWNWQWRDNPRLQQEDEAVRQRGGAVWVISADSAAMIPIGQPREILCGSDTVFAMYGEELTLRGGPDIDAQIVAVTKPDGTFVAGLAEEIHKNAVRDECPLEATTGCVTAAGDLVFTVYAMGGLWTFSAVERTLRRRLQRLRTNAVDAISERDGTLFFASLRRSSQTVPSGTIDDLMYGADDYIEFHKLDIGDESPNCIGSVAFGAVLDSGMGKLDIRRSIRGLRDGRFGITTGHALWLVDMP